MKKKSPAPVLSQHTTDAVVNEILAGLRLWQRPVRPTGRLGQLNKHNQRMRAYFPGLTTDSAGNHC